MLGCEPHDEHGEDAERVNNGVCELICGLCRILYSFVMPNIVRRVGVVTFYLFVPQPILYHIVTSKSRALVLGMSKGGGECNNRVCYGFGVLLCYLVMKIK